MASRTISVGLSRLFRLVEIDGTIPADYEPNLGYRIEQAHKDSLTKKWKWTPLAFANTWGEAHGALHQMQADFVDKMIERQGTFNGNRKF